MKYYYFISFDCFNSFGSAKGNDTLELSNKIRNIEDVKLIQKHIENKQNVTKVTISNIVLLDSE